MPGWAAMGTHMCGAVQLSTTTYLSSSLGELWLEAMEAALHPSHSPQSFSSLSPPPRPWQQVTLGPVDCVGRKNRLREGAEALPPSVVSLALPGCILAEREGGAAGAAWRMEQQQVWSIRPKASNPPTVPNHLALCAAFDQPGKPCGLVGRVGLVLRPPADDAGPGALGAYLGQCAELGSRLGGGGGAGGVVLCLTVGWAAARAGGATGALTALAMGLPRPVDAAGRPAGLGICAWGRARSAFPTEGDINSALAAAGRGWVRVELR
jgi:hypothetical protein